MGTDSWGWLGGRPLPTAPRDTVPTPWAACGLCPGPFSFVLCGETGQKTSPWLALETRRFDLILPISGAAPVCTQARGCQAPTSPGGSSPRRGRRGHIPPSPPSAGQGGSRVRALGARGPPLDRRRAAQRPRRSGGNRRGEAEWLPKVTGSEARGGEGQASGAGTRGAHPPGDRLGPPSSRCRRRRRAGQRARGLRSSGPGQAGRCPRVREPGWRGARPRRPPGRPHLEQVQRVRAAGGPGRGQAPEVPARHARLGRHARGSAGCPA